MFSENLIEAQSLSKVYLLYKKPEDRLTQMLVPRLKRLVSWPFGKIFPQLLIDLPRYEEFWALRNVSVTLARGETLGIIGQNGSGKSTLLQIICGTLTPTSGSRSTSGRVAALLELGAGFNPDFTGRENVYLNAAIYGLTGAEIEARMQAIVDFAEIGAHIDQPVKTYSSGMFVRLAFSVIANVDADILIIDEALAVGDAYFQQKCMRFLRKFQENGSVFFVSHDTSAMMNFCDRVIWLDHGVVRAEGDPRLVCEEYLAFLYQQHTGGSAEIANTDVVSLDAEAVIPSRADAVPSVVEGQGEDAPSFNLASRSFGDGAAQITRVELSGADGGRLASIRGGEAVELKISFRALSEIRSVISGFIVKDRLGQYLFGDNTFASTAAAPLRMSAGEFGTARFRFVMPLLAPGTYSVAPSVASGTLREHVQHHWMHEGLIFTVHSTIETGVLVGIPMEQIELKIASGG